MRYLPNGTLDASFSGDGIADFSIGTWATMRPGLVRAARWQDRHLRRPLCWSGMESFLMRFNTNGSWDSGFGTVQLDMAATSSEQPARHRPATRWERPCLRHFAGCIGQSCGDRTVQC